MSPFVDLGVDVEGVFALGTLGDDDLGASCVEVFNDPVGIEGFIGQQSTEPEPVDQGCDTDGVVAVSRQELEPHEIAQGIG